MIENTDNIFGSFVCASLPDSTLRRRTFAASFDDPSHFQFVQSIDGRQWTDQEADEHCSQDLIAKRKLEAERGKLWINPAAVACGLTHRDKLLPQASARDVILCEDDIAIDRRFISLWMMPEIRQRFNEVGGVVLLDYRNHVPIEVDKEPTARVGGFRLHRVKGRVLSGACYFASPNAARMMIEANSPLSFSADDWNSFRKVGAIETVHVLVPSPVRQTNYSSTIGYGSSFKGDGLLLRSARSLNKLVRRSLGKSSEKLIYE